MAQGFLIDMDGVIYGGDIMIPGADEFVARLLKENIPFTFMTNNSQRTPLEVVRKLRKLGIEVTEKHVYAVHEDADGFRVLERMGRAR